MIFENTVQTGYAFWAGLAKVFCSRCPSWTLVGRFHPPTLRSPLLTAHIWSQDQCSPTLSRQSKIYHWDNILTSPKILFTVLPLWPLTLESELWPVYVDENVNTCKQPPSPDTLCSKLPRVTADGRTTTWYNEETKQSNLTLPDSMFSFLWFHFRKKNNVIKLHTDSIYVGI